MMKEEKFPNTINVGKVNVPPSQYVDDSKVMTDKAEMARNIGEEMTRGLNEISLKANSKKSSVAPRPPLVVGQF